MVGLSCGGGGAPGGCLYRGRGASRRRGDRGDRARPLRRGGARGREERGERARETWGGGAGRARPLRRRRGQLEAAVTSLARASMAAKTCCPARKEMGRTKVTGPRDSEREGAGKWGQVRVREREKGGAGGCGPLDLNPTVTLRWGCVGGAGRLGPREIWPSTVCDFLLIFYFKYSV